MAVPMLNVLWHAFSKYDLQFYILSKPGAVARLDAGSILQHSFVEIGHEIISMAILSLLLIPEGQLSVTGERMCSKYW